MKILKTIIALLIISLSIAGCTKIETTGEVQIKVKNSIPNLVITIATLETPNTELYRIETKGVISTFSQRLNVGNYRIRAYSSSTLLDQSIQIQQGSKVELEVVSRN